MAVAVLVCISIQFLNPRCKPFLGRGSGWWMVDTGRLRCRVRGCDSESRQSELVCREAEAPQTDGLPGVASLSLESRGTQGPGLIQLAHRPDEFARGTGPNSARR